MKDITLVDIGEGKFNEFYLTIDVDALANEPFPLKE
jgi:hypothetical protein